MPRPPAGAIGTTSLYPQQGGGQSARNPSVLLRGAGRTSTADLSLTPARSINRLGDDPARPSPCGRAASRVFPPSGAAPSRGSGRSRLDPLQNGTGGK